MYFKQFPTMYYQFEIGNQLVLKPVTDITTNVRLRKEILENITLFDEYDIKEGETPEIIATKVYGSPLYHWVIMLCNQRYNYLEDFPLSRNALDSHVASKYENPAATHHYEDQYNNIVMSDYPDAYPVSNYDYEDRINESKRRIKLISPGLLSQIMTNYASLV